MIIMYPMDRLRRTNFVMKSRGLKLRKTSWNNKSKPWIFSQTIWHIPLQWGLHLLHKNTLLEISWCHLSVTLVLLCGNSCHLLWLTRHRITSYGLQLHNHGTLVVCLINFLKFVHDTMIHSVIVRDFVGLEEVCEVIMHINWWIISPFLLHWCNIIPNYPFICTVLMCDNNLKSS